jgi:hypothetical protein
MEIADHSPSYEIQGLMHQFDIMKSFMRAATDIAQGPLGEGDGMMPGWIRNLPGGCLG